MSAPALTAVGVHIFAGGFSIGVRAAGFEVACHLESSAYGVSTAERCLGVPAFWPERSWPLREIASEGPVALVYANPPCAVFSAMGATHDAGPGSEAWRLDARTGCWWDVLRVAAHLRPSAVLLESVAQAYGTGRPLVDEFTRRGLAAGYHVAHLFVDARRHGLPQRRRRFLLCLTRASFQLEPLPGGPPPTVGEVLARAADPGPYSAPPDLIQYARATPLGGAVYRTYDAVHGDAAPRNALGRRRGRPSFQDKRLDPDDRDGFVVVGDKLWHPSGERRLGTEEYKALCGFPAWFQPQGPQGGHASLLARGLMPPVAAWVAACAARTVASSPGGAPSVRLVDVTAPGEPRVVDLTAEYLPGGARSAHDPQLRPPERPERPVRSAPRRGSTAVRVAPPAPLSASEDPPQDGEGSGRYMQRLLLAGVGGDECVARVHQHFPGRKTKRSDAYYNWRKLHDAGHPGLPPWRP